MDPTPDHALDDLLQSAPFLQRIAGSLLGDEHEAMDATQDAWVVALEKAPERDADGLRAWMGTVVRNVSFGRRRTRARQRGVELAVEPADRAPRPDEVLERESTRRVLLEALLELPEHYREPLLLRYYEASAPPEIARRLELPLETVRTRLKRGLALLRRKLDGRFEGRDAWCQLLLPIAQGSVGGSPGSPTATAATGAPAAPAEGAGAGAGASAWSARRVLLTLGLAAAGAGPLWLVTRAPGVADVDGAAALLALAPSAARPDLALPPGREDASAAADAAEVAPSGTPAGLGRASLLGRVIDPRGAPVVSAEVRVRAGTVATPGEVLALLWSDVEGRFELAGLPERFLVDARADGLVSRAITMVQDPGAQPVALELELAPGRTIAGQVRSSTGGPVAGARIANLQDELVGNLRTSSVHARVVALGAPLLETTSRHDGSFELGQLAPTPHVVRIEAPDFAPRHVRVPLDVERLEVVLDAAAEHVVRVVDPFGTPLEGARVRLAGAESPIEERVSDAQGRASFGARLARESIVVRADARGRASAVAGPLPATEFPEELELVLDPPRRLTCRLIDALGAPVVGQRLRVHAASLVDPEGGRRSLLSQHLFQLSRFGVASTDAAGVATIHDVPSGALRLLAPRPHSKGLQDVALVPADVEHFEWFVAGPRPESVVVRGRVLDGATLQPLDPHVVGRPGVRIVASESGGDLSVLSRSLEDDGSFHIVLPYAADWTLVVQSPDHAPAFFELPSSGEPGDEPGDETGEPVFWDAILRPRTTLELALVDASGAPRAGVVALSDASGVARPVARHSTVLTSMQPLDERGRVVLAGLPAAPLVVDYLPRGLEPVQRFHVDVASLPPGVLELVAPRPGAVGADRVAVRVELRRAADEGGAGGDDLPWWSGPFRVRALDAAGAILCDFRGEARPAECLLDSDRRQRAVNLGLNAFMPMWEAPMLDDGALLERRAPGFLGEHPAFHLLLPAGARVRVSTPDDADVEASVPAHGSEDGAPLTIVIGR